VTTANQITILRILLVPVFVGLLLYYSQTGQAVYHILALSAFGLAALSDGIDGYIARRYNQRSELGALLDPVADKLLLVSGLVLLSFNLEPHLIRIPLWLTVTVFSRDLIQFLGWVIIQYTCGHIRVVPHPVGKVATVLQMICISWVLLRWPAPWLQWWAAAATLATVISALIYIRDGVRQLSASPSSSPAQLP